MGNDSAMCVTGSVINHVAQTLEDDFDRVLVALMLVTLYKLLEQFWLQCDDNIIQSIM